MMISNAVLLAALQHGDSFFPSGTIPFSWGLETLAAEGALDSAADVCRFVEGQLTSRWATCDRPALVAAYRAVDALDEVANVDNKLDTLALSREMREGGRRAGGALLDVHSSLGTPRAGAYRDMVRAGEAPGQLAAAQGLVWRGVGLNEEAACAISAHVACVGFVGAAIRLGLIGHIDGQRILSRIRPVICRLLAEPLLPFDMVSTYVPAAEIAMMRHETSRVRIFAN
jgi:urease accessory protein